MKSSIVVTAIASILVLGTILVSISFDDVFAKTNNGPHEFVEGQLIISFKPNASPNQIDNFYQKFNSNGINQIKVLDHKAQNEHDLIEILIKVPEGQERKFLNILRQNPHVEYVELNYVVHTMTTIPNDSMFPSLWGLHNTGQTGGTADADIDAPAAWDFTTGSYDVIVGVIDTGVDYTHPDLAANIWVNPNEIPGNGLDDDGNGYVDDIHGINAITGTGDPMDDHDHGSHVSGTIGGVGNNVIGVTGVNWDVTIIGCKFLNSGGSGSTADAQECVEYFNDLKYTYGIDIKLTSNSWGGGGFNTGLNDAFEAIGQSNKMIHVMAAGNSNSDNDVIDNYPANYPIHNKLVVAASDHNDNMASFSSYGEKSVHLAAPGVAIWSTIAGGGYDDFSGTSMATPHVSGAAALIWSNNSGLSYDSVQNVILCNVDPISVPKKTITNGRLNIGNTVGNDVVNPSDVTNLSATQLGFSTITISFDATGDDNASGDACYYDVRYSTSPITDDSTWDDATRAGGEPKPQTPGSSEAFEVSGLESSTTYYIGVKAGDEVGNESLLSNIITATTVPGTIVFEDDMEGGVGPWDPGLITLWHTSEHQSHSSDRAWYYGQEVIWNYDNGVANTGRLQTGLLDLTDAVDARLTFWEWSALEASTTYDRTRVMVFGGSTWTTEFESHGTNGWEERIVDLNSYVGNQVIIGFDFDTIDGLYNNYEGWYIDDVQVEKFVPNSPPSNQPPSANAGPDQAVNDSDDGGSESVTLDGSGSGDDSAIVSWDWSEGGNPIGSGETYDASFSVGVHTVTLMVTDDDGDTDTDAVDITVNANQAPTADAGADKTVTDSDDNGSEDVTLDGSSSSDSDGTIDSYEWKDETNTVIGNTASISPTVPVGTYVYTLTVTDNGGAIDVDTVSVTVDAPSAASASLIKPAELEQVSGKTKIEWVLSGFTGQTTVEVYVDGNLKTTITSGKVSFMWNTGDDGMGDHIVSIEVTDTNNNSDNDSRNVEVVPKGGDSGGSDPGGSCPPGKVKKNLC